MEEALPRLIGLPAADAKAALLRLLHARPAGPLSPERLAVALHRIQASKVAA